MPTLRRSYGIIPKQNDIRNYILRADQLYFNNDVFSCATVHLVHLDDETLSEKGTKVLMVLQEVLRETEAAVTTLLRK